MTQAGTQHQQGTTAHDRGEQPPAPRAGMPPAVRVEMLSDPIYLSGARELVSAISKRLGFDELGCSKIALAVDEALCNVIRHGYRRATDRPIWIAIWPLHESGGCNGPGCVCGIQVVIEDEAQQVDPAAIRGRELEDVRPGGLGVHIIREVMDHVVYERRERQGMRLTLRKQLTSAPRPNEPAAAPGNG